MRQQFNLPATDKEFLEQYDLPWETIVNGSQWLLLHKFPTHDGYNHPEASIAILLSSGYPDAPLDMVYVHPPLQRNDGKPIPQTTAKQNLDGKDWQRWSRHRTHENPWQPGKDSIETHIYLIEDWFVREFEK